MEITSNQIEELRNAFLNDLSTKGDDVIHPTDLNRVKNDDFWLERFLKHSKADQSRALGMLWGSVKWRKEFGTNDINESNLKMDFLVKGNLFPHGKDVDGCHILVFKCKQHVKGSAPIDDVKRIVVYWFERCERLSKGQPISVFFDMEGCGLSNMDMEFTKYLIGLFKEYYPYFLNYIIIFEMPWVLSAAFKIIKSWLPEEAVEKIKFVSKKDFKNYVPVDQALKCWGGESDYVFSYVPDEVEVEKPVANGVANANNNNLSRKVHFSDDSSKSELSANNDEKEGKELAYKPLKLNPASVVSFVKDGNEFVGAVEIQNVDSSVNLSYKIKTTAPEKFRVKPNTGCLPPGAKVLVNILLLEGYQVEALKHDKFLILSMPLPFDAADMSPQKIADMWKATPRKKISEYRLKCQCQSSSANSSMYQETTSDGESLKKLSAEVAQFKRTTNELQKSLKCVQLYQLGTIVLFLIVGLLLGYFMHKEISAIPHNNYCTKPDTP